jgi:hypothetical protein
MSRERLTAHGFCSWPFLFLILLAFSFAEAAEVQIESIKIEGAARVVINSKGAPSMTNHVLAGSSITTVTQSVASGQADASGLAKFSLPFSESLMFFRVRQDNSISNVMLIEYGQAINEKLVLAGGVRTYQFMGEAGDMVIVGAGSRDFRVQVQLLNAQGLPLTNGVSEPYSVSFAHLNAPLPASGAYFILVGDVDNLRAGDFSMEVNRANAPINAVKLSYGQSVADSLDKPGQMKMYSFDGREGDIVRFRIGSHRTPPVLELHDSRGALVKSATNTFGLSAIFETQLQTGGLYSLFVTDQVNSGGDYFLYVERLNGPGFPTPIAFGQTIETNLNVLGQAHAYRFDGEEGDLVRIVMNTGIVFNGSRMAANVELFDESGASLKSLSYREDNRGGDYQMIFQAALPRSGVYYMFARNFQTYYIGGYTISLQRLYNRTSPLTMSSGETLEGNISFPGEARAFSFQAEAGDVMNVTVGDGDYAYESMEVEFRVMDKNGVEVEPTFWRFANDAEFTQLYLLETAGKYIAVVADEYNDNLGKFRINVNGSASAVPVSYGQSVAGEISTIGQVNAYRFEGQTGLVTRVTAKLGQTTNSIQLRLLVADDRGRMVKTGVMLAGSSQISMDVELRDTGPYFVFLSDSGQNDIGPYSLSLEQSDRFATSKAIAYGQTLNETLTALGEVRCFRFQGEAGDQVQMAMTRMSTNIYGWRPGLRVSDEQGRFLVTTNSGVSAQQAFWDQQFSNVEDAMLPTSGTYYVWASALNDNAIGDFALSLDRLNGPAKPILISYGQTIEGTLKASQAQSYQFEGKSGDWVRIVLSDGDQDAGTIDPALEIVDGEGLERADAAGPYGRSGTSMGGSPSLVAAVIEITLTNTGPYIIFASDRFRHNGGRYYLSLYNLNSVEDVPLISYGQTLTGTIDKPGKTIAYRFEPKVSDLVRIEMRNAPGLETTLNPKLELKLISGVGLWYEFAATADGQSATVEIEIVPDGGYLLLAEDAEHGNTGAYELSVSKITPPEKPRLIGYGEIIEGMIAPELESRVYSFQGQAGDLLNILLMNDDREGVGNLEVELRDAAGTLLASGRPVNNPEGYTELTVSGTFSIIVKGRRRCCSWYNAGHFWLGLAALNRPLRATPIVSGQTITDPIRAPVYLRTYSFDAQPGEIVWIAARGDLDLGSFKPSYALYDDAGTRSLPAESVFFGANSLIRSGAIAIERSGRYYLSIAGGLDQFLNWIPTACSVRIEKLSPQAISYGQTVEGSVDNKMQVRMYVFDALEGDRIHATMNSGDIRPLMELRELKTFSSPGWSGSDHELTSTARRSGAHCILAGDAQLERSGRYSIKLEKLVSPPKADIP